VFSVGQNVGTAAPSTGSGQALGCPAAQVCRATAAVREQHDPTRKECLSGTSGELADGAWLSLSNSICCGRRIDGIADTLMGCRTTGSRDGLGISGAVCIFGRRRDRGRLLRRDPASRKGSENRGPARLASPYRGPAALSWFTNLDKTVIFASMRLKMLPP
jgi:hypothetical protein